MDRTTLATLLSRFKAEIEHTPLHLPFKERLDRLFGAGSSWPALRIGNLSARTPIVQGGMGVGISLSGLASAVANAGGIGVIAANGIGLLEKGYFQDGQAANIRALRSEIRKARSLTDGIIGVNIMVAISDFDQLLQVCIEERVDLVFLGAGLPIKGMPVEALRAADIKVIPIISSARAASLIFRMWKKLYGDIPDAVVVEGPMAGGHLGFSADQIDDPAYRLERLVGQVIEALAPYASVRGSKIPVIAAGGVYSGSDIHRLLRLGSSAVQMATRFVATEECDADTRFKEAYIKARKEDIGLIESPVGMPGRAIRSQFILDSEAGMRPPFRCAYPCLSTCKAQDAHYCISIALNNARKGNLDSGFVFAGSNAFRIKRIVSVRSLVDELERGYQQAIIPRLATLLARFEQLKTEYEGIEGTVAALARSYESLVSTALPEAVTRAKVQYRRAALTLERIRLSMVDTMARTATLLAR